MWSCQRRIYIVRGDFSHPNVIQPKKINTKISCRQTSHRHTLTLLLNLHHQTCQLTIMATSKIIDYFRLKDIVNQRIVYDFLNYTDSQSSSTIKVAITITSKYDKNLHNDKRDLKSVIT